VQDVVLVRAIKTLRDAGCPLQKVREAKSIIEAHWSERLTDYVLYWDGGDVVALDRWGNLQSLVLRPTQQVLHLVAMPLASWRTEARAIAIAIPHTDPPSHRRAAGA